VQSLFDIIFMIIWVANLIFTFDAARHPATSWAAADRKKFFWVAMFVAGCFFFLPALVILPGYLIGVRPRFARAPEIDSQFRKY
jgi:hypothetical protein